MLKNTKKNIIFLIFISVIFYYVFSLVYFSKKDVVLALNIDGILVESVPTNNWYELSSYSCKNGSTLSWNKISRRFEFSTVSSLTAEKCTINLVTSTVYLRDIPLGSYVSYTGTNGCPTTEVTGTNEAQSANACAGKNANQNGDSSNFTYGYCSSAVYGPMKFSTYGWRLAYTYDSDSNTVKEPYLVAAGSPQCIRAVYQSPAANVTNLNTAALKYCNSNYVYNGSCTSANVWAIKDSDFQYISNQLLGVTKTLSNCFNVNGIKGCGYRNDMIDNGGQYWYATAYNSTDMYYFYMYTKSISNSGAAIPLGLRPVIHLKQDIKVTSGSGTITDPYQISYN